MSCARLLNITILLQDGKKKAVSLPATEAISSLISNIQNDPSIQVPPNTYPVILYHGKIADPASVIGNLETMDDFTVHCFFKIKKAEEEQRKASLVDLDLRGFDRLQRLNYSQQQIERIRANFRLIHQEEDLSDSDQIEVEDEWFTALFAADLSLDTIDEDTEEIDPITPNNVRPRPAIWKKNFLLLFLGFILGYFLGIGSLIFGVLTIRSKRTLFGIFIGSCAHYANMVMNH